MAWWSVFSIIDKVLPKREERIRNEITKLKARRNLLLNDCPTNHNLRSIKRINKRLRELSEALQNR